MAGIVLEDNCHLLPRIPVSVLRQPLLRGGRSPRITRLGDTWKDRMEIGNTATFYTEDAVMRGNTEHFTVGSVRSDLQRSLRHGFPPLFATGFIQDTDPVFSVFHPAVRLNMIPVFRSSLFSD